MNDGVDADGADPDNGPGFRSVFPRGNAWLDAFVFQSFPEPIGVMPAVPGKVFGLWRVIEHKSCGFVTARSSLRQEHHDRPLFSSGI